jgi:Glycosyl hydrolase family 62
MLAPRTRWFSLAAVLLMSLPLTSLFAQEGRKPAAPTTIQLPSRWEYTAPLIRPELREVAPSHAQKDPSVVFHDGKWHVFLTVKLQGRTVMEYCSFTDWKDADRSPRTLLQVSDRDYFCAPQVFYFDPHKLWYLIYQVENPGSKMMWVACSTTATIGDPASWTKAQPILDGSLTDPRQEGGLDYWIICDSERAYLFWTTNNGMMWRMWTRLEDFPKGFDHCKLALVGNIFEASHTYKIQGRNQYLTLIEVEGRRYYKAYVSDRLDGMWKEISSQNGDPFASAKNIQPAPGVSAWTDNVSHGELIRVSNDQTLTIDPENLRFVFQGLRESEKSGKPYGQFPWRIGMLTPVPRDE